MAATGTNSKTNESPTDRPRMQTVQAKTKTSTVSSSNSSCWHWLLGLGMLLFVGASWLTIVNEQKAAKHHQSSQLAQAAVKELPAPSKTGTATEQTLKAFQNQLIHYHSNHTPLQVSVPPTDPLLKTVSNPSILILERRVQIYQWVEKKRVQKQTQKGTDLKTKFHYEPRWMDGPVSDANFRQKAGHRNTLPDSMRLPELPFPSQVFIGQGIHLPYTSSSIGNSDFINLQLSSDLVNQLWKKHSRSPLNLTLIDAYGENDRTLKHTLSVRTLPNGADMVGSSIFVRAAQVADNFSLVESELEVSTTIPENKKALIQKDTMTLDGEERTLYVVSPTEESFSTFEKAQEALWKHQVDQDPRIETVPYKLDGVDQVWYQLKGTKAQEQKVQRFSTPDKALEAAQNLPLPRSLSDIQEPVDGDSSDATKAEMVLPKIGDIRIQYRYLPALESISFLADLRALETTTKELTEFALQPWVSSNGYKVGRIHEGNKSAVALLDDAQKDRQVDQWIIRLGAWLLWTIGWALISHRILVPIMAAHRPNAKWNPALSLADGRILGPLNRSIPFLRLGESVTWMVCASIRSAVTKEQGVWVFNIGMGVLSLTSLAGLVWIRYRPLLGSLLVSIAMSALGILSWVSKAQRSVLENDKKQQ